MTPNKDGARRSVPHRGLRTSLAVALASLGPIAAFWGVGSVHQNAAAILAVFVGAWCAAWSLRSGLRAVVLASIAAGAVILTPTLGMRTVIAALLGATLCVATFVEWRPFARWPDRRHPTATLAAPFVIALPLVWASTGIAGWRLASTIAVGAVLVGLHHLAPAVTDVIERPVRRALERSRLRAAGTFVADAVSASVVRLRGSAVDGVRWAARARSRRDVSMLAAVVVGGLVRTLWVIFTTTRSARWDTPYAGWNFRIAEQFAAGATPSFGGEHTAYWPPGYGAILSPLAWLADRASWLSLPHGAAAVNVLASIASIVLAALLAQRWFGPGARNPAAWIVALWPGLVYMNTAAVAEPVVTALLLGVALGSTWAIDTTIGRTRSLAVFSIGVLVGAAALVRDVALFAVLLPALCVRTRDKGSVGLLRTTALAATGAAVLIAPWTARNLVQVGWPSPNSTIAAEGLCVTKYDLDVHTFLTHPDPPRFLGQEVLLDCYRGSLFDTEVEVIGYGPPPDLMSVEGPDEGTWARRLQSDYAAWAVSHPWVLLRNVPYRLYGAMGNDLEGGYVAATGFGARPIGGPVAADVLQNLANGWYLAVLTGAVAAIALLPRARRAAPVWFVPLVYATYTWLGPWALSRHVYPSYPFLAVLAAASLVAVRQSARTAAAVPAPDVVSGGSTAGVGDDTDSGR